MRRLPSIAVLVVLITLATPVVASSQAQYPPPVPTPTPTPTPTAAPGEDDVVVCFTIDGDVDGRYVHGQADHGSNIRVGGLEGTADMNGKVELFVDNKRAALVEFRALEDGSFTHEMKLPAWVKRGHRQIIGVIEGCVGSDVDLEVLGAALNATDTERTSGDTSGVLPRTGMSILSYLFGAFALLAIGTVLLVVRHRRRDHSPLAPGVPHLDTSHFLPRSSRTARAT